MFDNMDLSKMGEFLSKAQERANELEEKMENTSFSANAGAGLIKISANGKGELIELLIDDELLKDKDALATLILCAANEVLKMVEDNKKGQAADIFTGFIK